MLGGVVTQQWTVGDRIPGVANYAQVNKVFSDCDYKGAPQVSVTPSGLPGFSVGDAPSSFLSSLKFWGGKRKTRKTMKKGKKHMKGGLPFGLDNIFGKGNANENMKKINTSLFNNSPAEPEPAPEQEPAPMPEQPVSNNGQQGGAGGLAYGPSFEVIGPNPVRFETRLGCESGAAGPQPPMMQAVDSSILSKLKFWGGKKTRNTRKTRKNMKGGMAPLAGAFDVQAVRGSPYTLTPPGGNVYEVPRAGFSIDAPLGGNNAGMPPYDQVNGYPAAPVLAGACKMTGGRRKTSRKTKKRSHRSRRHH